MTDTSRLKVSYCITCKGRLHHLKETLYKNLAAEAANPNVEFVLLDYDSPDGLGDWIKTELAKNGPLKEALDAGRFKYVKYEPAPYFKMAHAKNMAHRMATGGILCNLDADNILPEGYSEWLQKTFSDNRHAITIQGALGTRIKGIFKGKELTGSRGRIAIQRDDFYKLRGYDEEFNYGRGDDNNFTIRARGLGIAKVQVPLRLFGDVIDHSHDERVVNLSPEDAIISKEQLEWSAVEKLQERVRRNAKGPTHANIDG